MDRLSDLKSIALVDVAKTLNTKNAFKDIVAFEVDKLGRKSDKQLFPIRFEALVLVQCIQGETKAIIDLKEYTLTKDSMLIIHPRNYLMNTFASEDFRANMIMCSEKLLEDVMPRLTEIGPLFVQQRSEPIIKLTEEESVNFVKFYDFLKNMLAGDNTPFFKRKITCLMQSLFYEIMDYEYIRTSIELRRKSRKQEVMAKFVLAVSENFRTERQVSFYAEKICITPKHLSAVVKDLTGKTASDWIERYVILEAKMLLKSTDLTIQEISNRLNFTNQSFFGKYFKHQTGYSPSEYRQLDI